MWIVFSFFVFVFAFLTFFNRLSLLQLSILSMACFGNFLFCSCQLVLCVLLIFFWVYPSLIRTPSKHHHWFCYLDFDLTRKIEHFPNKSVLENIVQNNGLLLIVICKWTASSVVWQTFFWGNAARTLYSP